MPDPSTTTTVTTADPLPPGPGDGRERRIVELTETLAAEREISNGLSTACCRLKMRVADRDATIAAREKSLLEGVATIGDLRAQVSGFHEEIDKMRAKEFDLCSTIATLRARLARADDHRLSQAREIAGLKRMRDAGSAPNQPKAARPDAAMKVDQAWYDNFVNQTNATIADLFARLARAEAIEAAAREVVEWRYGSEEYLQKRINALKDTVNSPVAAPTPEPGDDFDDFLLRRQGRRENFERSQTPEARRQVAERLAGLRGEGAGQREVGDE